MQVKCYGGPAHGQVVGIADDAVRVSVVRDYGQPRFIEGFELDWTVPQIIERTYYIERYCQRGHQPMRQRELHVAILEGAKLEPRELSELDFDWGRGVLMLSYSNRRGERI